MAITVKGYQRHVNGKTVTVHGYAAKRNPLYPSAPAKYPQVHSEVPVRPSMTAPVGTYIQPNITRGIGGLTAYLYAPGGPTNRDIPTYRWRRTNLPKRGAYEIPKTKDTNDDYNSAN